MKVHKAHKNILLTVPNLSAKGGVSAFWNSLLVASEPFKTVNFIPLEIGGHGKNIFGILLDQYRFNKGLKDDIDLAFLNPSLVNKSFFRDGFFAKQLVKKEIPFVVFFHGWDLAFEKKVHKKYVRFFMDSFGQAKNIFVLSISFKNKLLEWGYKGKVIVETTIVDSSLTKGFSIENKQRKHKTSILFLARILKEKGVFELVEAFEKISKNRNDIELVIAGDGDDFDSLKNQVSSNRNITLTGFVEGDEKANLFKQSDLYCLASYSEGLPISLLEAISFGLPIITTPVGGLRYFFRENKMGYFVTPREVDSLIHTIDKLLTDKEKMMAMEQFNFEYAKKYLVDHVVAKRIHNHLELVLNTSSPIV